VSWRPAREDTAFVHFVSQGEPLSVRMRTPVVETDWWWLNAWERRGPFEVVAGEVAIDLGTGGAPIAFEAEAGRRYTVALRGEGGVVLDDTGRNAGTLRAIQAGAFDAPVDLTWSDGEWHALAFDLGAWDVGDAVGVPAERALTVAADLDRDGTPDLTFPIGEVPGREVTNLYFAHDGRVPYVLVQGREMRRVDATTR
jgi:hypothetical protein